MPSGILLTIECCASSQKEEKSADNCIKHKIIEEVGFMLFLEYIKNLNRFKAKHRVFKAKGTRC